MSVALTTLRLMSAVAVTATLLSSASADEGMFRVLSPSGGGTHPVVLLVPGCSGFVANSGINVYDERAAELQASGYLVVYVDYIGKRMQTNCAHVGRGEVTADILEAAKWAAVQSGVDPGRISVIGWSYGAGGVLAALNAIPSDPLIAKAVLYYPVCRGARQWSAMVTGLMLLGAADDIALPATCNAVAKELGVEKLKVITYPNARHGFDMRGLPKTTAPGAPGYDPEAATQSWAAVLEFLK